MVSVFFYKPLFTMCYIAVTAHAHVVAGLESCIWCRYLYPPPPNLKTFFSWTVMVIHISSVLWGKKEWKNKYWLCEYCDLLLWCIGWVYSMCNNFPTLFREPYYNCQRDVCSFWELDDWKQELSRTGCQGWRLSVVNQSFQLSTRWSLLHNWYIIYLFPTIGLLPGDSGYFTCKQNMKLVT